MPSPVLQNNYDSIDYLALEVPDGQIMLGLSFNQLYRSTDYGTSWLQVPGMSLVRSRYWPTHMAWIASPHTYSAKEHDKALN